MFTFKFGFFIKTFVSYQICIVCLFQIWTQWMSSTQDSWSGCQECKTGPTFLFVVWTRNHQFHCCKTGETEKKLPWGNVYSIFYLTSLVVFDFRAGAGCLTINTTEYINEVVTNDSSLQLCFFFYISIWSSRTVAGWLPSVLYAITITSLFKEALSIWVGQICTVWSFAVSSVRWVMIMFSFLGLGYCCYFVNFSRPCMSKSNQLLRVPSNQRVSLFSEKFQNDVLTPGGQPSISFYIAFYAKIFPIIRHSVEVWVLKI